MKAGKEYELLIEQMYRSLEPNAIITHDDHIYDDRAKIARQIDVSIKYKFAGVDHLIIVQAKDYKHKANISVVDQFQQVIEDVNANKGILICSKGFSTAAINKAKSYGIECLTVHSALNKNWEIVLKVPVREIIHEFFLNYKFDMDVSDIMEPVSFMHHTFSYDGLNVIGLTEIVSDHIIKKMGWAYVKKAKSIKIDLNKLGIYHALGNMMLPIKKGYVEIFFKNSYIKNYYIEPENYIYASDHIKLTNNLHNLTISEKTLQDIMDNEYQNDNDVKDIPVIHVSRFVFNEVLANVEVRFSVRGNITGNITIRNGILRQNNDKEKAIQELERHLKNKIV